ncbi:MAG: outer membrane lipoprotein-sorting protein [Colwelliaceae bacterium]|nr:outer membrane lipoprotein-sorting protein [Colwelliaceae bacterium]
MKNKTLLKSFLTIITYTYLTASVNAESLTKLEAEKRGLEISKKAKQQDTGWKDSSSDMLMFLRNKQGQESLREIKTKTLELLNDGDKSLTIFNQPRDVKGTSFLSFSHPVGNDDQWLYLPSLKRVKRISSRNKSGPFMGSEFSFEDLSSFEIEKYQYNYLGDEAVNGLDSFMVEQFPVDENSGYTRRIVWIDKSEYRVQKIDFYDRKNSLLKTLSYENYQQYLNRYWRADSAMMINHQSGKSTELQWSNYEFSTGLTDGDFNRNTLKRAR